MLAIIVPYRDREDHLKQFIPHMRSYLPDAKIIIVEQADTLGFNRGKLLNIGATFAGIELVADYFAFHDVDKLPVRGNYSYPDRPRQIAPNPHQTRSYFGGVTLFSKDDFLKVDGYNNTFWGWGGEDNELMFELARKQIYPVWQYGEFIDLPHARPEKEFDMERWQRAQMQRKPKSGLTYTKYDLISKEVYDTHTHLKVSL